MHWSIYLYGNMWSNICFMHCSMHETVVTIYMHGNMWSNICFMHCSMHETVLTTYIYGYMWSNICFMHCSIHETCLAYGWYHYLAYTCTKHHATSTAGHSMARSTARQATAWPVAQHSIHLQISCHFGYGHSGTALVGVWPWCLATCALPVAPCQGDPLEHISAASPLPGPAPRMDPIPTSHRSYVNLRRSRRFFL